MENVIIIGGGPAGLSAAIYLARAGLSPLVFAGSPAGGQLTLTSEVENYPGYESILGMELIEKMRQQAQKFGTKIIDQNITKADLSVSKKEVESEGKVYPGKAIIVAVGASALWLNVPGEQKLRGKGVSACATCDGFFFKDKVVAVIGGGDTAMEEALTLTKFAKKVYLIHRRDSFRASKIMQERVFANPKIEIIWNTTVEKIIGEKKVEGIKIVRKNNLTMKQFNNETIHLDGIFIAIGHRPATEIFKGQLTMDEKGYIITSERIAWEYAKSKVKNQKLKMAIENSKLEELINKFNLEYKTATSVDGVFAAGDCVDFIYRQAGTAVGMGIAAALEAEKWLNEKQLL
ncbi:MAG: NAD(P)/FAD-dependent oxidoreductase [Minisyncoccia bacterium]